jgi:hypothetical protein
MQFFVAITEKIAIHDAIAPGTSKGWSQEARFMQEVLGFIAHPGSHSWRI